MTLKPLNRFLYAAYHLKEETLGFLSMHKTNQSIANNDFTTHYSEIEGNFTCIDRQDCPHGREEVT